MFFFKFDESLCPLNMKLLRHPPLLYFKKAVLKLQLVSKQNNIRKCLSFDFGLCTKYLKRKPWIRDFTYSLNQNPEILKSVKKHF